MQNGRADAVQLPLFDDALRDYDLSAGTQRERGMRFMTTSSEPIERLYTPRDFPEATYIDKLGFPGQWPYTRGVHATPSPLSTRASSTT